MIPTRIPFRVLLKSTSYLVTTVHGINLHYLKDPKLLALMVYSLLWALKGARDLVSRGKLALSLGLEGPELSRPSRRS